MISNKKQKRHSRLPTLKNLSKKLSVSVPTVRKAIRVLESKKIIQNYDSLGFFVLSDRLIKQNKNRINFLLHMSLINLTVAKEKYIKKQLYGKYSIIYDSKTDKVFAYNIFTQKHCIVSWTELKKIIDDPITVEKLIQNTSLRSKYIRQQKLFNIANVISLHKKELGIKNG